MAQTKQWAVCDRYSKKPIGKTYPHEEQAWTDAVERGLVIQGRLGARGETLHILQEGYVVQQVDTFTDITNDG